MFLFRFAGESASFYSDIISSCYNLVEELSQKTALSWLDNASKTNDGYVTRDDITEGNANS